MSATTSVTLVQLSGGPALPLLVCGPSLGTSATTLWSGVAERLGDALHVVAWDLPGHGTNHDVPEALTIADLAAAVMTRVDALLLERGEPKGAFVYAGDSVGGAVGLQLLLDEPQRVTAAALLCTGATIGEPDAWRERASLVRSAGAPVMVENSAQRWFAPGFLEREPTVGAALLHALQDADRHGYAAVCEALAAFDVRDRLGQVTAPVLAIAGADDTATPPSSLAQIADGVQDGRLVVLDRVAHLAPVEAPAGVAHLLRRHLAPAVTEPTTIEDVREAGMAMRRAVLGDAHVDRATAATTDFTAEFQAFITQYAWGTIWTRPGLDRRSRSFITLTAMVARGHHDELAMHVRAARTNGVTDDEIKELLLQTAVYCGVPDANTAFKIAQKVLADLDQEDA